MRVRFIGLGHMGAPMCRWVRSRRGRLAMAILFAALVLLVMLAFSLASP
jgi:3-hydroxyisobutyrate dehydrogenase-like beta-hydroxyacid dehydrogenase